jgi:hypothetical protein
MVEGGEGERGERRGIQFRDAQYVHEGRGREGMVEGERERGERRGIQIRYAQHVHEGGWRGNDPIKLCSTRA